MVTGLLAVAKYQYRALKETQDALAALLKEDEYGHCFDAVYEGYSAKVLLKKLDIKLAG